MVNDNHQSQLSSLGKLSESELQEIIIEPILRAEGFSNVVDNSGPNEKGKDLIATKVEGLGRRYLYSIQIKKFSVSGRARSSSSLGRLIDQLKQLTLESVLDPETKTQTIPDRALFITPKKVSNQAREAFANRLKLAQINSVELVDGQAILDLMMKHKIQYFGSSNREEIYRMNMRTEVARLSELRAAMGLGCELNIADIYIETDVVEHRISQIFQRLNNSENRDYLVTFDKKSMVYEWKNLCKLWLNSSPEDLKKMTSVKKKKTMDGKGRKKHKLLTLYDIGFLWKYLESRYEQYCKFLKDFNSETPGLDFGQFCDLCRDLSQISKDIENNQFLLSPGFGVFRSPHTSQLETKMSIPSSFLLKTDHCLFVSGGPGQGKSTFLRNFAIQLSKQPTGRLPVFIPLIKVPHPTYNGLLEASEEFLRFHGWLSGPKKKDRNNILARLKSGDICYLLDGLDEVGTKAPNIIRAMSTMKKKHPKIQIIVSGRNSFYPSEWEPAAKFFLREFTQQQILEFVNKWFSSEPSKRAQLNASLIKNEALMQVAQRPLNVALLCSLIQHGFDTPQTEVALFRDRLELLLGKWEQAKNIQPMGPLLNKRYKKFLFSAAYFMQSTIKRTIVPQKIYTYAKQTVCLQVNCSPERVVDECIMRGLLEKDYQGQVSFGHFTYQEFFAAQYLHFANPIAQIWEFTKDPWWHKTIEFYAGLAEDIGPLLEYGLTRVPREGQADFIFGLRSLAPLTKGDLFRQIRSHLG